MANNKRRQAGRSLSIGRPPSTRQRTASLSASATRTLIRSHHRLHKQLHKAETSGDTSQVQALQRQIEALGGLKSYQQASILGQSKDRGGDSSVVLMQWLQEVRSTVQSAAPLPRLLEVGALSTENACSRSNLFEIERIDLNSQSSGILCQDFMERPLPKREDEMFDIISLSLVLNYVPDAVQRGEMLKRTHQFLHTPLETNKQLQSKFPALFVVLPAACITNSRYLDNDRFAQIMKNIGYQLLQQKQTAKLIYSLWHHSGEYTSNPVPKVEVNPGVTRNNFTIVLE